jgi:hypothetical protein
MLKAIHAQENRKAAAEKMAAVIVECDRPVKALWQGGGGSGYAARAA